MSELNAGENPLRCLGNARLRESRFDCSHDRADEPESALHTIDDDLPSLLVVLLGDVYAGSLSCPIVLSTNIFRDIC